MEGPQCFDLMFDYLLVVVENECHQMGIGLEIQYRIRGTATTRQQRCEFPIYGTITVLYLGYADDCLIVANTISELEAALNIFYRVLQRFDLVMSLEKTETQVIHSANLTSISASIVSVGNCYREITALYHPTREVLSQYY